jgi:hypothetical protein
MLQLQETVTAEQNDAGEVGLKVSVPIVPGVLKAEVPIRWSLFREVARPFRKTQPEQLVRVVGARAYVHVHADDEGTVDVYLKLVNLTDRPLSVEALNLELYYTGGVTTPVGQPLFRAPEKPIPPFDMGEVYLTLNLTAAAIRRTLACMQQAQNTRSSPRIELTVGGRLHLHIPGSLAALQRAKKIALPFLEAIRQVELNINCPSARV